MDSSNCCGWGDGGLGLLAAKFPLTSVERDFELPPAIRQSLPLSSPMATPNIHYPVILRRSDRTTLALSGKAAFLYFDNLVCSIRAAP